MKVVFALILLLVFTPVFSQRKFTYGFSQISLSQYDSCRQVFAKSNIPFTAVDSLTLTSDGNESKFQVLRSKSDNGISVLHSTNRFLIIIDSTGVAEDLIGMPLFNFKSLLFVSFGFSKIYRRQMLQIGSIKDHIIDAHLYIRPEDSMIIHELGGIIDGRIYLEDTAGRFWICDYKFE